MVVTLWQQFEYYYYYYYCKTAILLLQVWLVIKYPFEELLTVDVHSFLYNIKLYTLILLLTIITYVKII